MTKTVSRPLANFIELLSSMRFAISLLVYICLASIIGTVIPQGRSANSYIDQFGPFWFDVFNKFSIWHIYNNWWFLVTMAFLVTSTSLCLIRNAPKMLKEARSFREHIRTSSLQSFHHRVELDTTRAVPAATASVQAWLKRQGYAVRQRDEGDSVLLAAKRGSGNRLGYIFAHASIVIICVGGLLDSELPVRLQVWLMGKTPIVENMLIADVPERGRLSVNNPSYRANVLIPEGSSRDSAVVNIDDGALVQPLPFSIALKKFIVDYYSTGMPSRFASIVEVTDPDTGKKFDATIEVNEPLHFKGVTVYQSSFDDGGSLVELVGYPLAGPSDKPFELKSRVGQSSDVTMTSAGKALKVEVTKLRPINVEDLSAGDPSTPKPFGEHVAAVTGSAAGKTNKNLRNIGPSVEYRVIDESGQATLFHNYMVPVELDGARVMLAGVQEPGGAGFRYLRLPVDEDSSMGDFIRLRAALSDPAARQLATQRLVANYGGSPEEQKALQISAERALDTFATGGLLAISNFLEKNVPEAEQRRAADIIIRLLGSSIAELRNVARERAGLAPVNYTPEKMEEVADWSRLAVAGLSDLALYPSPIMMSLKTFEHVQASVFQVSRTPGKITVYIGCLLLIIGIFTMFYVRDRRIWVWLRPAETTGGTRVLAAMTSQKRTLDFNREFDRFKQALARLNQG
ncbi:cytochrome c biogenesis protein ResB [Zwartia vadi]|uniref:cytochrome c biogenesis protein ResB n=1 Tax=Zwartia vadi TaxID=3058168 RepID=UPI0025B530C4|nr:cytochrome c biogenesis protein ResB [Zwartia vadi]MDN3988170.1 cytochrome c biogenesis protein ResB [Zwartia vadi]